MAGFRLGESVFAVVARLGACPTAGGLVVAEFDGEGGAHRGADAGLRYAVELALGESDPLVHGHETKVSLLVVSRGCRGMEALPIVADLEGDLSGAPGERHFDMLRLGVSDDVEERFLRDPVEDGFCLLWESEVVVDARDDGEAGALPHGLEVVTQRGAEAAFIEDGGAQLGHEQAELFDGAAEPFLHGGELFVAGQAGRGHVESQHGGGERLHGAVVEVCGDQDALVRDRLLGEVELVDAVCPHRGLPCAGTERGEGPGEHADHGGDQDEIPVQSVTLHGERQRRGESDDTGADLA